MSNYSDYSMEQVNQSDLEALDRLWEEQHSLYEEQQRSKKRRKPLEILIDNCMHMEHEGILDSRLYEAMNELYTYNPKSLEESKKQLEYMYHLIENYKDVFPLSEMISIYTRLPEVEKYYFDETKKKLNY